MDRVKVIFSDNSQEVSQDISKNLSMCISAELKKYPSVFVVADRNVRKFITEPLVEHLAEEGVALRGVLNIKATERRKTLKTVEKIQNWLLGAGADRNALVLAVGGGITTDLAGFAAATYKRGVKYANLPTTLLAQTDAAIGGKTGCNINGYKNMCGAFLMPEFTFVCPGLVRTQRWEEFSAGYAELLKTFIIGDAASYKEAVSTEDFSNLNTLIRRAVKIKASIVESDFRESGPRRLLNLGHTFAHAIEKKSRGRISHGHAVAIGTVMAAQMSEDEGIAARGLAKKIREDYENLGLPTTCRWSSEQLREIIRSDKKSADGLVNYVLIKGIGDCVIVPYKEIGGCIEAPSKESEPKGEISAKR